MKSRMIVRTVFLTAWLSTALSFSAAGQTSQGAPAPTVRIGTTAVLTAADGGNGNLLLAQEATLSQSATIQSISFYVTAASGSLVLGVYSANGPSGGPGTLVAQTAAFTPLVGWNVASTTTKPVLSAGNYWLAYLPSSNGLSFVKENNTGNCYYYALKYTAILPTTFSTKPANCSYTNWSLYATLATTTTPPTLKLSDSPASPSVPANAAVGTVVTALTASWSNGTAFTGTLAFASPDNSDGGLFALSRSNVVVNGSLAKLGGTTQEITVQANSSVSLNIPIAVTSVSSGGTGGSGGGAAGLLPSASNASANWQMAGMLSQGGIPNRTTVCATVKPIGGGSDDTTNIQNAIAACPLDEVVMLGAGKFTIAEGNFVLLNKGVTLRGSGAGSTILQRTNGATLNSDNPGSNPSPMIIVGPDEYNNGFSATTTLTTDGAAGSNSIVVASATGFSVGQFVLLDEASGAAWQPDRIWSQYQIWASPDYRVVWQKHNPAYEYVDDFDAGQYPYTVGSAGCWFSNCDRPTNEMHRISAISGNTITFDSPLTISYRVSHHAQLYNFTDAFTTDGGVENMTLSNGDDGQLIFNEAAYCWAKGVESTLWLDDGFDINYSFRVQLEEVYAHNAAWPVNGGGGYAISIANGSSEALIENSISILTNKVIVARSSGAGSVVAYNYMDDGYINGEDAWTEIGVNGSHMVGSHHMLFEGNYSFNADSDQTHGNAIYHSFFRNYLSGFRKPFTALDGTAVNDAANTPAGVGPLRAVGLHAYAYWDSFVGNVLGTPGEMSGWTDNCISSLNNIPSQCIWMLGYMDITPQGYDPNVAATSTLDGNYDYVTNAVAWAATDTAHKLPNSLYLTQKPAFFNAGSGYAWPWVVPTGSPQILTGCSGKCSGLPAKARYDAGTPFTQP
jgi:hypothetical protein